MTAKAPVPNYGKCRTCGLELLTKKTARAHMTDTANSIDGNRSHTVTVLNSPREDMVKTDILMRIDDAVADLVEELMGLVECGTYTDAEVESGLWGYPDFQDAWNDREGQS